MPDKRTHAGQLNVTTGRTHPPPLTEGHEMPHMEERIADGHMTPRAQTVAICAALLVWGERGPAGAISDATEIVTRALEWDRHERLQAPPMKPLPPQRPAYVPRG